MTDQSPKLASVVPGRANVKRLKGLDLAELARALYAERRRRDDAIGIAGELFGEPVWDMLLYLYSRGFTGTLTSTTALCDASCSPGTTALRWTAKLTEIGLIERHTDKADRRRSHVRLTDEGVRRVEAMLRAI